MIPKIIHYCWFGGNPKNELINKCIESWKKYCSDYKIIEWNENNFDISSNKFVREAYESKKWAFVSDYVRLYVLYKFGGIYVDTDLEITRNIDEFLKHKVFTSHEDESHIPTALMGAEKNNEWIKELLNYYNNRNFILSDGSLDMTTNVEIITNITKKIYNVEFNNKHIVVGEDIHIYPREYFCVYDVKQKNVNYSIHHFNGSWVDISEVKNSLRAYKNNYMTLNHIINDMYNQNDYLNKFIGNKSFSIYGFGSVGKLLVKQCEEIGIYPKHIIDKSGGIYKNTIVNNEIRDDMISDILIITPMLLFSDIYNTINTKNFKTIVNINEIYEKENLLY